MVEEESGYPFGKGWQPTQVAPIGVSHLHLSWKFAEKVSEGLRSLLKVVRVARGCDTELQNAR